MKSKWKYFLLIPIFIIIGFLIHTKISENKTPILPQVLLDKSTNKPYTILLVPGHDVNTGGASFNNIYERDVVVDLAQNISQLLSQDPKYKVIIARDKQSWNPIFADYLANNKQSIIDFKNEHQAQA